MSMLDAFFKKNFNAGKCKTLLKLTIPRIKLLRNRREIQLKQMRKDIAKLLETGQEATARIRVEHIIREENMMAAQEIIELFCELISVRLPIIETQRECPLDLKEAISSICFAAPRCSDLPELQQVQMLFASKYGKEFVAAATELIPDCGVNRQMIELLSIRAPSAEAKLKLLKEIAEEHELEWDPGASESEFLKPHADLLNGPNQFISGSKLPLPKEKHDESLSSRPVQTSHEESDTDADFDSLDFPEVPKVLLRPSSDHASAAEMVPPPSASPDLEPGDHEIKKSAQTEDVPQQYSTEPDIIEPEQSVGTREDKQFLPFISPPMSATSFSVRQSEPAHYLSRSKSDTNAGFQDDYTATKAGASSSSFAMQSEPVPSLSRPKYEANVDLQDVLTAAQSAAESAERAAAAARAAASLAQVRITELLKNSNNRVSDPQIDSPSVAETHMQDGQRPFAETVGAPHSWNSLSDGASVQGSDLQNPISCLTPKIDSELTDSEMQVPEYTPAHQPQRLSSLEDDAYFSYPNLFASQDSSVRSGIHASADNSPSGRRPE
ncbi:hypothetical protein MRB53_021930 [Persea americana]|uniref:Uncharacterized protein n=1 Tax=Persea americana TaxID=3435 RepID=A0ACC2L680_PERAE|nr:hypothetical protein MRB53_021930 [Persea americana]